MRVPSEPQPSRPRRPGRARRAPNPHRRRILLIAVVVALFALFLSARGIAGFYTDYLWFDSLHLSGVFTGILGAKVALAAIFTALFFVLMFANLFIADRLAPAFPPQGPEAEFLERYRQLVGSRAGLVRVAVSVLFALIAGVGTSGQWRDWILFTHRVDFGIKDPQFHKDVGFYVFQLPFISSVISWLFATMVIILIVTAVFHYLNGGIRVQVKADRVTPQVKAHLSVLLGVLAIIQAVSYWFDRYSLNFSSRGAVNGATYTDVKAQLPALTLLMVISLTSFVLLIVNIRRRGWVLPTLAVGLWGVVAVAAGAIYPAVVQRFFVQPSENKKELPYIARNIEATRHALALDKVATEPFSLEQNIDAKALDAASPTLSNLPLVDRALNLESFTALQTLGKGYYTFNSLNVDHYLIDGKNTQVVLGVRELDASKAPQKSWVGQHLQYTHGSGIAIAGASQLTAEGRPRFLTNGAGPALKQSSVYFSEKTNNYAIVNTKTSEISLTADGSEVPSTYAGTGGVTLDSGIRRLAFALRFGEANLLLSGQISGDSRILYVRDVQARVQKLAPFLEFDADPYPVVRDGRVQWIIDAYTTTNNYPYGQNADNNEVDANSGLNKQFNYVRNSVKAVVDAYDGSVKFYVVDPTDPLIRAYQGAFPELFTAADKIPPDLAAHFRYPTDLFRVQTNMWGRYQLDDPSAFYNKSGAWVPSLAPGVQAGSGSISSASTSSVASTQQGTGNNRVAPQFGYLQLPGSKDLGFVQLRTFVPISENDSINTLASFMTASVDAAGHPFLRVFTMPAGRLPDGPQLVEQSIKSSPEISSLQTLLGKNGSEVHYGAVVPVPIGNSLAYINTFYVKAEGAGNVKELKKVIVSYNAKTFVGDTLAEALKTAFGASPDLGGGGGVPTTTTVPTPTPTETVDQLLKEASDLYDQAQKVPATDLAKYQDLINKAFAKVQKAAALTAKSVSSTTTTTPGASTTTTPGNSTTAPPSGTTTTSSTSVTSGTSVTTRRLPSTTSSSTPDTVNA